MGVRRADAALLAAVLCSTVLPAAVYWCVKRWRARLVADAKLKAVFDGEDSDEDEHKKEQSDGSKEVWQRIEAVLAEYSLTNLGMAAAKKWVRMMGDPNNVELARLRQWMLMRVNGHQRAPPPTPWQSGCPEIFGGLRAQPVWDVSDCEWLRPFEENFEAIRDELLSLRSQRGFQPLKLPTWTSKKNTLPSPDGSGSVAHDAGDWNVFYLFLHEVPFPDNCAKCPVTTSLLKGLGARSYSHAFFSALTPGTHILQHHGPTNKKLRVHLPLIGALGSELRVADQLLHGQEGKCMVFDDSFEHEAWHRGDATRIVLVFDVWHPVCSCRAIEVSAPCAALVCTLARGVDVGDFVWL